ncbi:MAG TPA: hypothetical protein V6C86_03315 [Oculatellaceae cyanobacterium]
MSIELTPDMHLLFTVEDTFDITGRGLVVISGPNIYPTHFKSGNKVSLKRPNGELLEHCAYVEMNTPNPQKILALSLPGLTKNDVPIGTEIWAK